MEQGARPELLVDMKALEANVKRIDIVCELKI
jgi:hypothetical protein